jgi:HK97 family phage major capsid protein
VPSAFDRAVVTYPLLHGEIYPFCDIVPVQTKDIESAILGNPSAQWGTAEGTQISLLDTDDLITDLSGTCYPVSMAIIVGRDMLSDSPVNVGSLLVQVFGSVFASEMDKVIVSGSGTNRPQGITQASGITSVSSTNGASGPWTPDDFESLMFAVEKQYRSRPEFNPSFISNDTVFRRRCSIKVDSAETSTDQRRVFGMNHNTYSTLGWPHRIENTDLGNAYAIYVCLKKYRVWRRSGFEFRLVTEGKELARKNENMFVFRARVGGLLVDANACAVISDGQT